MAGAEVGRPRSVGSRQWRAQYIALRGCNTLPRTLKGGLTYAAMARSPHAKGQAAIRCHARSGECSLMQERRGRERA